LPPEENYTPFDVLMMANFPRPSTTDIEKQDLEHELINGKARVGNCDNKPLISVVVAVSNAVELLGRCIASVAGQIYPHKELIVIDGGSVDGTKDVIETHAHCIAHWESEPDRGIYHAWNKALKVVRGDWVYFLGADDYFIDEQVLARVAPYLSGGATNARVVYGLVHLVKADGSIIGTFGESWNRRGFFQLMTLPHQGVFHHRSLFSVHGGFNEEFRIAGDYELLLRELKSHDPVFIPDAMIAAMQFGGMSSDGRLGIETLREIKRARDLNGVTMVTPLWRWALVKAHVRRWLSQLLGQRWTKVMVNGYRRLTLRSSVD
jgi:glycosyltransferase involved in cell wall biosynthesis